MAQIMKEQEVLKKSSLWSYTTDQEKLNDQQQNKELIINVIDQKLNVTGKK